MLLNAHAKKVETGEQIVRIEPAQERISRLLDVLSAEAAKADAENAITQAALHAITASGLALMAFPLLTSYEATGVSGSFEVGGSNQLATLLRALGAADLSIARLFEGHINAVALVRRYGTRAQLERLRVTAEAGGLSGVWAADGAVPLRARNSRRGLCLEGGKILASGAGLLARPLVTAQSTDGQIMVLLGELEAKRIDVSGWTVQGMRSSATGSVDLDGLLVPSHDMVGEPGDFMRQPHFSGGAWRFCAAQLGAMERLVDLYRDHLTNRNRGGDAFQLGRLATCVAAATTTRLWVMEASRRLARPVGDPGDSVAFVNLTRMVTERSALDILEAVQRGVGLSAFVRPNPIERVARDLATYLRQPVPDLAMTDAAQTVLGSPRPFASQW